MGRIIIGAALAAAAALSAYGTHGILLVPDQVDGVEEPQDFTRYYKTALRDNELTYAVWDHYTRGEPTFEDLRKYKIIIWFTATSGDAPASDPLRGSVTLSPAEQEALVSFLAHTPGTTAVMLSGSYIAWNCVADATHEKQLYKPLFSDYLKLDYPADNFDNWIRVEDDWKLAGYGSDKIVKDTHTISWRHHRNFPDQLESAAGGNSAWWQDLEGKRHHRAVIRSEGTKGNGGTYRIALFSCPFENILHNSGRKTVMADFIGWTEALEEENAVEPASVGRVKALFR